MSLYYESAHAKIYHGDAAEHPEWWTHGDVLVTDPPYGINFQSGQRPTGDKFALIKSDNDTSIRDRIVELWGSDRPALVFGTWKKAAPVGERQRLIWHKVGTPGMGDLRNPWGPAHEDIHLLGTGWNVKETGHKRLGSILSFKQQAAGKYGDANKYNHPTPKPLDLMQHLIERCPEGTIVDPFAGSGATIAAATLLGRQSIGVEIEEQHCETMALRIEAIEKELA